MKGPVTELNPETIKCLELKTMTRSTSNMRKDPDIPNLTLILASSVFVRRGISFINAFLRLSYLYLRLFWRFYVFLSSFYTFLLFFSFTSALIGFLDFLRPPRQLLMLFILSRGHSTLHLAVSVGMSVGPSVGPSRFWILSGFCITAPAQPSATGLPCIRPC